MSAPLNNGGIIMNMMMKMRVKRGKWSLPEKCHSFCAYSSTPKASSHLDISGIFPPIPTPFNSKNEVDFRQLQKNFQYWNKIPFAGEPSSCVCILIYKTRIKSIWMKLHDQANQQTRLVEMK
jgi:hypothetical protein